MSKMKALQPEMEKLKARYGEDKQRMNQELMQLYRREKVNPGGRLPADRGADPGVLRALQGALHHDRDAPSAVLRLDQGSQRTRSAHHPDRLRLFHWQIRSSCTFFNIGIWPLIMGVTMYLQQKLNPAPTDPVQARVFQFLPIMFTFMLAPFSAGLVIYWAWSNTLSIAQQYYIMRKHGAQIGARRQPRRWCGDAGPARRCGNGGGGGGKKGKKKR
jgi:YidC/Oxa1 family membrane protein insertase